MKKNVIYKFIRSQWEEVFSKARGEWHYSRHKWYRCSTCVVQKKLQNWRHVILLTSTSRYDIQYIWQHLVTLGDISQHLVTFDDRCIDIVHNILTWNITLKHCTTFYDTTWTRHKQDTADEDEIRSESSEVILLLALKGFMKVLNIFNCP